DRLGAIAARHGLYLAAGIAERGEDGFYYDSAVLLGPDGRLLGCYRKIHLFSAEKQFFYSGDRPALFDTPYGRVALTICYDLVFPEYVADAARMAYAMAGVTEPRREIHVAEPYDPFDYKELHHLDGLGLAPRCGAAKLTREGVTQRDGDLPVCPSGG
ncbi:MAG: hypothetical protein C4289_11820, partial [Chloroflexota bacterium]